jgi:hypothetical protein
MLSVVMLSVVILSVIMLNVGMLSVIMLNVIILSVVAPHILAYLGIFYARLNTVIVDIWNEASSIYTDKRRLILQSDEMAKLNFG